MRVAVPTVVVELARAAEQFQWPWYQLVPSELLPVGSCQPGRLASEAAHPALAELLVSAKSYRPDEAGVNVIRFLVAANFLIQEDLNLMANQCIDFGQRPLDGLIVRQQLSHHR